MANNAFENAYKYVQSERRRISGAIGKSMDFSKDDANDYISGKHDYGFYGHLKSGSIKPSRKIKGAC